MENFSQLYLRSDVVSALENIGVTQPTVIQMLAIPKVAAGKNVLCASETGMESRKIVYIVIAKLNKTIDNSVSINHVYDLSKCCVTITTEVISSYHQLSLYIS